MSKTFDLGLIVGRFQHIHKGHHTLIDTALQLCDRVHILVGSSQEIGTLRNPYPAWTRIEMIMSVYGGTEACLRATDLPDLTNETDMTPLWGKHVLAACKQINGKLPEIMFYGNDQARSGWFDPYDIKDISEFIISRERLDLSATEMREWLLRSDDEKYRDQWFANVHPRLHKHFGMLRDQLRSAPGYQQIVQKLSRQPAEDWSDRDESWVRHAMLGHV